MPQLSLRRRAGPRGPHQGGGCSALLAERTDGGARRCRKALRVDRVNNQGLATCQITHKHRCNRILASTAAHPVDGSQAAFAPLPSATANSRLVASGKDSLIPHLPWPAYVAKSVARTRSGRRE